MKKHHFSLFVFIFSFCSSLVSCAPALTWHPNDQVNSILGVDNLGHWRNGILSSSAEAPGPADEPSGALVLAGSRTKRPDILNRFRRYQGGWDITDKHYWASVGFTGAAAFILAILWLVFFGLAMIIHHCCEWRLNIKGKDSRFSQMICLVLLVIFTCAAATGCILKLCQVYTPRNTRLLQEAAEIGVSVVSGVEMFIRQALGQFKLFTNGLAPEDFMRKETDEMLSICNHRNIILYFLS